MTVSILGPLMQRELERYGLASLAPWLATAVITGMSEDQLMLELYEKPEFKSRFPAIDGRRQAGLSPVSVDEYLEYEARTREGARALGVQVTQEEINNLILGDISAKESLDRIALASRASFLDDQEKRRQLMTRYGMTANDFTRYWLDPKKEFPRLQREFAQAMVAAEARHSGFAPELSDDQLGYLMDRGVTEENAADAFGKLVQNEELFEAVDDTEQDIGVDDQLKVITGDQGLAGQVAKRGEKRVARFQEGGGFSTGGTGVSGLGSANT